MYLYSYVLLIFFVISGVLGLEVYFYKMDLVVEWLIYSFNSFMIEVYILIDWVSCLFVSLVMVISSMVMIYSIVYMSGDKSLDRFIFLVILFIVSMVMMILSPSLVSILFGWDMLGLVSYCLVIYYQSVGSYNSGMVTVLSNRVGDVGILLSIGMLIMFGSWNIYLIDQRIILLSMIILAAITKSAQMPFSSWLPLAMAAPTPVSSLVHSSTLVTAGVYLMIRFNNLVIMSGLNLVLLLISVLTMFMSGLMASFEFDLKKIIALSTLSQLGLMMLALSVGSTLLGFYHLLTHAIFKSLLFLCAGSIIHSMNDNQDIRHCGGGSDLLPFVSMSLYISVLTLMGFPFLAGFYSKDMIMEFIYILGNSFILMLMVVFSLSLTVLYTFRLCYYLGFSTMKFTSKMKFSESFEMNFSMMFLMILSVIGGSLLNWCFFFDLNSILLGFMYKMETFVMMGLGMISWILIKMVSFRFYILKYIFYFSSSMWLLTFLHVMMSNIFVLVGGYFWLIDLVWVEVMVKYSWLSFMMVLSKIYCAEFKIYNVILGIVVLGGISWMILEF